MQNLTYVKAVMICSVAVISSCTPPQIGYEKNRIAVPPVLLAAVEDEAAIFRYMV